MHAEANPEKGYFVFPGETGGIYFALYAPLAKTRGDQYPVMPCEELFGPFVFHLFRRDPVYIDLTFVFGTRVNKRFGYGFIGIAQFNIFTHERDVHFFGRVFKSPQKFFPVFQPRFLGVGQFEFFYHPVVQFFLSHHQGYVINGLGVQG